MRNCKLKIELMSDLCVSDGSSYNSMIDTDICFDKYGFPYIPAKRIRGCLRECAIELNDWDDTISEKILFGEAGNMNNGALLRLGNAYIDNYDEEREFVRKHEGHVVVHPQNVLGVYSYIRSQTSIDYETGIAKDHSLRTIRVANKGLVFVADVEVDDRYYGELERCCRALRHMGVSRTRGMGEVKVSLQDSNEDSLEGANAELVSGATSLKYEIKLMEPIICKSVNNGEATTLDYIDGSKILGLISEHIDEDYLSFINKGKLICSNAYVSKNGERYQEAPVYLYNIKNDKKLFVNKLVENKGKKDIEWIEGKQLNQFKHCYVNLDGDKLYRADVLTEERYHHRRPEDKSIGRAQSNADNNADFYQMDSIVGGQSFIGYINGSEEQIKDIYNLLNRKKYFYLGYSKSSEYGKVQIKVVDTKKTDDSESNKIKARNIVVELLSPAIIYNEKAMASVDSRDLICEIKSALNIGDDTCIGSYIRYTSIGGFNVTWNKRKPTILAFDKGSAIHIKLDEERSFPELAHIGERTSEGYGEINIREICDDIKYIGSIDEEQNQGASITLSAESEFSKNLIRPILNSFVKSYAVSAVSDDNKTNLYKKPAAKPTVSNMLLMMKEAKSLEEINEMIDNRYGKKSRLKEEKAEVAKRIMDRVSQSSDLIEIFKEKYSIAGEGLADEEEIKMRFLEEYLTQAKYIMRGEIADGRE